MAGEVETPNPGSPEAVEQGCLCPVIDNGHGRGAPQGGFWIEEHCPLHARHEPVPTVSRDGETS